MSRSKNKNSKKAGSKAAPGSGGTANRDGMAEKTRGNDSVFSRTDYLCALPGILMCAVVFIVLLMDLSMPEMAKLQYQNFPQLFRGANVLIYAGGLIFIAIYISKKLRNKYGADSVRRSDIKISGADESKSPRVSLNNLTFFAWLMFGLFYISVILSTIVNGLGDKAIHGVSFRDIGIFHILAFIVIYMGITSQIKSRLIRRVEILMYIGIADLVAAAALVDKYLQPIAAFREKKDLSAIFFNGNHFGYFLLMAALASIGIVLFSEDVRIRVFTAASMILNGLLLVINGSSGCMLALAASLLFAVVIAYKLRSGGEQSKKVLLLMPACLLAVIVVIAFATGIAGDIMHSISAVLSNSDDASSAGHNRWLLWTETCKYIAEKPLLGYGCEGLSDILMDSLGRANPHNEILSYASQFGIPAAAFYTSAVILMIVSSFKNLATHDDTTPAALLAAYGYFVSSFFGVPMFYTLPFFFIFLGLSMSPDR